VNLVVVSGYREFLTPHLPDVGDALRIVRQIDRGAFVPLVRWMKEPTVDASFLFAEEARIPDRVALFLEYLDDVCPPRGTTFVLLPFESALDAAAAREEPADPRVEMFLEAAIAHFGAEAVRGRRLYLSETTLGVLRSLDQRRRRAPRSSFAARAGGVALVGDGPMTATAVDALGPPAEALGAFERNYTRAVLELASAIAAPHTLFRAQAERGAELLAAGELLIRPDLDAERILRAIEPGGELFELLTRPVLPPTLPTGGAAQGSKPADRPLEDASG
jgi:hypothetical protein